MAEGQYVACLDGSVKALQALPGDAIVIEVCPVAAIVSIALQELDVSLADDDIIWCGVIVQLLMPVLHDAHEYLCLLSRIVTMCAVSVIC